MHKLERLLYPALLATALAFYVSCRTSQPPAPAPAYFGEISINDSLPLKLDHARDTTILHRTNRGKVWVYQLENWTVIDGRRHGVVFIVELDSGEQIPHQRETVFRDGQPDQGGYIDYQSTTRPAPWSRWGTDGDRIRCRHIAGKLQVSFNPLHEYNGARRTMRGYISQP